MAETTETTSETPTSKPARKPTRKTVKADINKPTSGYAGPSGNRYRMVTEPRTVKTDGQIPIIIAAMKTAGRKGFTTTDIAQAVAGKFATVQTPLRVVRYYVSEWRKRGHIVSA